MCRIGPHTAKQLVRHKEGTGNDLPWDKRLNLAMTRDAFEPIIFRVAHQSNVQNHSRATLGTFDAHAVLRNSFRFGFCSRHKISQENYRCQQFL
jgi:hypothetical protein